MDGKEGRRGDGKERDLPDQCQIASYTPVDDDFK